MDNDKASKKYKHSISEHPTGFLNCFMEPGTFYGILKVGKTPVFKIRIPMFLISMIDLSEYSLFLENYSKKLSKAGFTASLYSKLNT